MPVMKFTEADIKSGFLVQNPGRYNYEILDVTSKPAKTDQSPNYTFRVRGLNGEMKDVVIFIQISSKAPWLLMPIFKAANGGKDLVEGQEYNTDDLKNVRLSAMTNRGTREDGSQLNNLTGWSAFDEKLV
jgi:hypothetical protein